MGFQNDVLVLCLAYIKNVITTTYAGISVIFKKISKIERKETDVGNYTKLYILLNFHFNWNFWGL